MSFSLTSPITGSAQAGLTSPTYTLVDDVAPDINGKQKAVSALGGTQTGVTVHSVSSPFYLTFFKPKVMRLLGAPNAVTGYVKSVPKNAYKLITGKGVTPANGQPCTTMIIETVIRVPAGAETYDSANVRAALSAHIGALTQQSSGLGDTCVSGVM